MQPHIKASKATPHGNLHSFDAWLEGMDKTRTTGWRWRKEGIVSTINIFGKLYITSEEIERFEQKAMSGGFHKEATPHLRRCLTSQSRIAA